MKKQLIFFTFLLLSWSSYAHPIKMATMLLDLSGDTPSLTINLFWDDFEAHMTKSYRHQLIVDKEDNQTKAIIYDYIKKHCRLIQNGNESVELTLNSYTYYEDKNMLQLHLKLIALNPEKSLKFTNTLLMDAFDNQTNVLHVVKKNKEKRTYQFNKSTPSQTFPIQ